MEDYNEKAALYYLVSVVGYNLSSLLDKIEEVALYDGRLEDAAEELFDECYAHEIPQNIVHNFDFDIYFGSRHDAV